MQKVIPNRNPALLSFALAVAAGAEQYGASIPLSLHPAVAIRVDITGLVDGTTGFEQAMTELRARRVVLADAVETTRSFLMVARDNAKPVMGNQINPDWAPTGFRDSLQVPRVADALLPLLLSFKEFLTSNGSFEVVPKNITAAKAGELYTELDAARNAVNQQEAHIGNLRLDREAKAAKLRTRMRHTIGELNQKLDPMDMKWLAFGLNKPGSVSSPEVPASITAVLVGPTAVALKWTAATRATSYRVWKKVVGVDAAFVAVDLRNDLDFTLEGLPAGAQVQFAVSAYNATGESALSAPATVFMPQ